MEKSNCLSTNTWPLHMKRPQLQFWCNYSDKAISLRNNLAFRVGKMSEFTHKVGDYIYVGNFFPKDSSVVISPRFGSVSFDFIELLWNISWDWDRLWCGFLCTQELSIHTRDLKKWHCKIDYALWTCKKETTTMPNFKFQMGLIYSAGGCQFDEESRCQCIPGGSGEEKSRAAIHTGREFWVDIIQHCTALEMGNKRISVLKFQADLNI